VGIIRVNAFIRVVFREWRGHFARDQALGRVWGGQRGGADAASPTEGAVHAADDRSTTVQAQRSSFVLHLAVYRTRRRILVRECKFRNKIKRCGLNMQIVANALNEFTFST
jgi:hypothetical protein